MVNINELSEQSKELVYLIYRYGGSFVASKLNRDGTISLRALQHKEVNIDVPKDEAILLYEAGHLCIKNIDIISGRIIIKQSSNDCLKDYKYSRDHKEFLNQHPKVREETIQRDKRLQEFNRKLAEEKAQQKELERIQKEKEEAYLRTPKGKIEHGFKKVVNTLGDIMNIFDGNPNNDDGIVIDYAKKRSETNSYIGTMGSRMFQKANDKFVVDHFSKKK